jgi:excinuclease ABC subunit B
VLVGVNLLREGLDLPEVSLVAILDADKEGFLRAERSLIQTIGRAARHVQGQAILYADNLTDSMASAIEETERRRAIQQPTTRKMALRPNPSSAARATPSSRFWRCLVASMPRSLRRSTSIKDDLPLEDIPELIGQLEKQMKEAAKNLDFEEAAKYRDRIKHLRDKLLGKHQTATAEEA